MSASPSLSPSSTGCADVKVGYDAVPANMTVHRQAHAAAFWAAEMIAGSWSKCVERLQRVFVDAEEKDLYLVDEGGNNSMDTATDRPRPRTWSFADVRPFVEHRRLVCSRMLLSKLAKAQEGWHKHPLSVQETVLGLISSDKHDTLPWYDVGQVICHDVWVALFLHFDRLIPPPTFFQENSTAIFAEDLVVTTSNLLIAQQVDEKKGEQKWKEKTGGARVKESLPPPGDKKKETPGAAASENPQPDGSITDDVEDAAVSPPPLSPRSESRIKQLDTLHASIVERAAKVDDIELGVAAEAAAAGQYADVAGAFGQDLVRARATVSNRRLAQHANELAQVYGNLEKLQFTKVDAIITADLTTGRADAKLKRKALTKAISELMARVVSSRKRVMSLETK